MSDFQPIENSSVISMPLLPIPEVITLIEAIKKEASRSAVVALPNWVIIAMCNSLEGFLEAKCKERTTKNE